MPRKLGSAVLITAATALLGCRETGTSDVHGSPTPLGDIAFVVADSAGVRVVAISGSVDSLPEWTLSEPALTEIRSEAAPFVGSVGEVVFLGDGRLLVEDDQAATLRVFGADGRPQRLLGSEGDGPGELRDVTQLSVTPGDAVHAFDRRHHRISSFDADGGLVTTIAIPGSGTDVQAGWVLGPDRILLFGNRYIAGAPSGPQRLLSKDFFLSVVSGAAGPLVSPVQFADAPQIFGEGLSASSPFANRPFVAAEGGRILSGSARTYELVVRDLDLHPLLRIRWPGWERPVTDSVAQAMRTSMEASLEPLRSRVPPDVIAHHLDILKRVFRPEVRPDTLPALGTALLSDDGTIWVARFRPPGDLFSVLTGGGGREWTQEDIWHILAADGTPLARVRLPPETRLLAVRGDRVAVVTRDDLGAESVRVLTIDKRPRE